MRAFSSSGRLSADDDTYINSRLFPGGVGRDYGFPTTLKYRASLLSNKNISQMMMKKKLVMAVSFKMRPNSNIIHLFRPGHSNIIHQAIL